MTDTASEPPPLPDLTRLMMVVHTSDSGQRTLAVSFLVNVQQTLMPEFEAAAHDAVLRHAHARGYMPVGPILIMTETFDPAELGVGTPGAPVLRSFEELSLKVEATAGNIVKVSADVELGLSLD
jgi:hypothetical protein